MSDHFTTQYNHKRRILTHVRDLFYWTKQSNWDFYKYLDKRGEMIFQHNSWQRLTNYNKEYVMGYMDRMYVELEQNLEWRVFVPDLGHVFSQSPDGREALKGRWSECISELGCSFWAGTDKVWFAGDSQTTKDIMAMYANDKKDWDEIVAKYVEKEKLRKEKLSEMGREE